MASEAEFRKGSFEELDYQHDEAWIGGPGIPSYADASDLVFLEQ
jgi:hypothetical protein